MYKLIFSVLLASTLFFAVKGQTKCATSDDCPNYNICEEEECVHGGIIINSETLTGTLLIMFVTGLANAAGSSGSILTTLFLLFFFGYNENKAIIIAYVLVFGGSIGNFVNVGFKLNPVTGKSTIDYDIALLCMPMMLLGTNLGIVVNRMIAPLFITAGLIAVMYISIGKIWAKAKKEFQEEPGKMRRGSKTNEESGITTLSNPLEALENDDEVLVSHEWREILKEEYDVIPKRKIRLSILLLSFILLIAILKGTSRFPSMLGIENCSQEYWGMFLLSILGCLLFFLYNRRFVRKIIQIKKLCNLTVEEDQFQITDETVEKLGKSSLVAGVLAGLLGMGGSTVMGPVLLGLGVSVETVVATSGFFVVQTSFTSLFQSILYGDLLISEFFFFLTISFLGSYGISYVLRRIIQRFKRPSLVLFILVFIFTIALIAMPIFEVYKSFYDLKGLLTFHKIC